MFYDDKKIKYIFIFFKLLLIIPPVFFYFYDIGIINIIIQIILCYLKNLKD